MCTKMFGKILTLIGIETILFLIHLANYSVLKQIWIFNLINRKLMSYVPFCIIYYIAIFMADILF